VSEYATVQVEVWLMPPTQARWIFTRLEVFFEVLVRFPATKAYDDHVEAIVTPLLNRVVEPTRSVFDLGRWA
jgi:hypothetical protein